MSVSVGVVIDSSSLMRDTGLMRVLVVEDERRLATIIREELEAEGLIVDIEHDGEVGLWRATEGAYDAIVLDIMLPSMSGYKICRELRGREVWTPVLMLTAKDGDLDEAEALDTGADDFLRKPFSVVVLLARLRAIVRRGATPRPTVLSCGPLRVDPATRAVTNADRSIDLSPREYEVLELLLRHAGAAVNTDQILSHVWGMDGETRSNVVAVVVASLRRKIDVGAGDSLLVTVRGHGYRMNIDVP